MAGHNCFMAWILFSLLLQLFIFKSEILAQSQNYQFLLYDNSISLDLFQPITLTDQLSSSEDYQKSILYFKYKLKADENLPTDIPLFLLAFDKEVIFYADANLADGFFHEVNLDLNSYFQAEGAWNLPVFYKNQYFSNLDLELIDFNFLDNFSSNSSSLIAIKDLSVIAELDQSLTVIFSLEEGDRKMHFYELLCLDEANQQIIDSIELIVTDNFLWKDFGFASLFGNAKNELIFRLENFNCDGFFQVVADGQNKSEIVELVEVGDL